MTRTADGRSREPKALTLLPHQVPNRELAVRQVVARESIARAKFDGEPLERFAVVVGESNRLAHLTCLLAIA